MQTILLNYTQTQLYKEQREDMITTFVEEYDNTNNALTGYMKIIVGIFRLIISYF